MNPELASRLMEIAEGRELRDFLLLEASNLNRLDDIQLTDPAALALETKSRQLAYMTMMKMLSPLLDNTEFGILKEKDDSISSEMLLDKRSPNPDNTNG